MHKKGTFKILMTFILAFALILSPISSVFAADLGQEAGVIDLTILHTNDIHGRAEEVMEETDNGELELVNIGLARYKTIIDTFKGENPNTIVLDAGDLTHGTNFASLSKGESMVALMNELGIDGLTPGNHDFNYGYDRLKELQALANFKFLASNITDEAGVQQFEQGYTIALDGITVGVFGLATPETKYKSSPVNTEGLEFTNVVAEAQREVNSLKEKGADVIVLLSHLGMDASSEINTYTVLDAVSGINVVIDGHSHTLLENGQTYNDTLIASTGAFLENVGVTKLSINVDSKEIISSEASLLHAVDAISYEPNAAVKEKTDVISSENDAVLGVKIGATSTDLDGVRENVRTKETNLGDLITDAILAETGADLVITNGGGIRASIPAGDITLGDALTVLPFGNLVTVIKVTGQDIIDALNFGAQYYPAANGGFPHIAGATYEIDTNATEVDANGSTLVVKNAKINGSEIDPSRVYNLATNDFMAIGGDGYTMFEGKEQVGLHGMMVDILAEYIIALSENGPFAYETDGRISLYEEEVAPVEEVSGHLLSETNIRSSASTEGEILATAQRGQYVVGNRVAGSNWIEVDFNGTKAYVYYSGQESQLYGGGYSQEVNMRTAPNSSSEIVRVIPKGEAVKGEIYGNNPNWLEIKENGAVVGYVYREFLQVNPIEIVGYSRGVNVRAEANSSSSILGVLPLGYEVKGVLVGTNSNWIKINYQGRVGYVYREFVQNNPVSVKYTTPYDMNLRLTPNGEILKVVKGGLVFDATIDGDNYNWYRINSDGVIGYIYTAK